MSAAQVHFGCRLGLVSVLTHRRQKAWFAWRLPPGPHEAACAVHGQCVRLLTDCLQPYIRQLREGRVQAVEVIRALSAPAGGRPSHSADSGGMPLAQVADAHAVENGTPPAGSAQE